ncbi:DUF6517 family protein [Halobium salinum]|uniref:DUF6517 family protein n=1 Tax=Halobium salinum TaxID=1364940 RepID=A0ABD5PDJ9_9EURY|nr:DUF6517 family protein [Halobium salinum]
MVRRRRLLAGAPAALALGFGSGCLGVINGDGLSFEASGARTEPTGGYEFANSRPSTLERQVAGRTVTVTNHVATYEKTLEVPGVGESKLGAFALVASPDVEVAGESLNPIGTFDNARLVEEFAANYGGIESPKPAGSTTVRMLGSDVEVSKYTATTTYEGVEVDVAVHVGKVRHEGDYVVALGVYPTRFDEAETVHAMVESVSHPA